MNPIFALIVPLSGNLPDNSLPPGFGGFGGRPDNSLPGGGGRPDIGLPVPPFRPSNPIVLPPGVWPPRLPPEVDNALPARPVRPSQPIHLPHDPDLGIEHPIVLPDPPHNVALLIALPNAQPKADTPPGTVPAILVKPGKTPVLVYVTAGPSPKSTYAPA